MQTDVRQKNALIILVFTTSRLVMNIMFRLPYAFLPVLARGLGVEVSLFSTALGLRSFASASAPFLAAASDSRGRKFGLLLGMVIFLVGMGLVVAFPIFPVFVGAMLLSSIGKAAFDPATQAYLGDRIPYRVRSRAIGVTEFSWSLSILIGVPLMGLVIREGGWAAPFPILFVLGAACLILVVALVPADKRETSENSGLMRGFRTVFQSRAAVLVLLGAMFISGANEAVNIVFAVWIDTSFGLQIAALSAASLAIGFAELGGESLVTVFTDRLGKLRSVLLGISLNCLAVLALPFLSGSLIAVLAGLFFFYLVFEFSLVSLIPLATEVLPDARATLLAFNVTFFFLGRALVALVAPSVFTQAGIWGTAILTIFINGLALAVLLLLRRQPSPA
ncbi:MAG: MFS transporter [Anaerolineales bacterium]|nr:MFS transporter [Anaerolineales bacterium]